MKRPSVGRHPGRPWHYSGVEWRSVLTDPKFTAWPAGLGLLVLVSCEVEWLMSDRFLSYAFSGWIGVGLSMILLLATPLAAWLSAALIRSWRLRGPSPWLLGWPFFGFLALILVPASSISESASSNGTNPPWLDRWLRGRATYVLAGLFLFHFVGALTLASLVYGCVQVGRQAAPLVFLAGLHAVVFRGLARLGSRGLVLRSEARVAALRIAPWCSLVPVIGGIVTLFLLVVLDEEIGLGLVGRVYRGRHAVTSAGRYRAGSGGRRFGHRARRRLRLERLFFARSLLLVPEVALWSALAIRWLPSVAFPARDALAILSTSWAVLGALIWLATRWRERWRPVFRLSGWLATTQGAALAGYAALEPMVPFFCLSIAFLLQALAIFYATLCTTQGEAELNQAAGERMGVLVALSVVVFGGTFGGGVDLVARALEVTGLLAVPLWWLGTRWTTSPRWLSMPLAALAIPVVVALQERTIADRSADQDPPRGM